MPTNSLEKIRDGIGSCASFSPLILATNATLCEKSNSNRFLAHFDSGQRKVERVENTVDAQVVIRDIEVNMFLSRAW